MTAAHQADQYVPEKVLRAKLRMAYYLLLLFLIHIIEAAVTFPFVDHTTRAQNLAYGFIVTAPFYAICILFILLVRRDLAALRKQNRQGPSTTP